MKTDKNGVHEYLGDGAYVTFDGFALIVKANHHETPTDQVALGPQELRALIRFAQAQGMIDE